MRLRGEPCTTPGCTRPIYACEVCKRCYQRRWYREHCRDPKEPVSPFMRVAEAFRVYWLEAESDAEFRRANWRARSALHRYALRLMEKRQRKVEA